MLAKVKMALFFLAAALLVLLGLFFLVLSPFLPLLYFDITPPPGLNSVVLASLGFACTSVGLWLGVISWRRSNWPL